MPLNFLVLAAILCSCSSLNVQIAPEGATKKYEIFTESEKSKGIQVSQLEQLLLSIEDRYRAINEKQKHDDLSLSYISSEVRLISQRLQHIESHMAVIEQIEFFDKIPSQFQVLAYNSMKHEVQLEDVKMKLDRNQQQISKHWDETDASLLKFQSTLEFMKQKIAKLDAGQDRFSISIQEINENSKMKSDKLLQELCTSQNLFQQEVMDMIQNSTRNARQVIKIVEEVPSKNNSNKINAKQIDSSKITASELQDSILNVNEKYNNLQEETKLTRASVDKCVTLADKLFTDMETQMKDRDNALNNKDEQKVRQLEMTLETKFDTILKNQEIFNKNCDRMKVHEDHVEDKAARILERLFLYIENKTEGIRAELKNLSNDEAARNIYETSEIRKLSQLILAGAKNDQPIKNNKSDSDELNEAFPVVGNLISPTSDDLRIVPTKSYTPSMQKPVNSSIISGSRRIRPEPVWSTSTRKKKIPRNLPTTKLNRIPKHSLDIDSYHIDSDENTFTQDYE